LEQRLGVTSAPLFILSVKQTAQSSTSAIAEDGDTTRFNVIGTATWALTDAATGAEIETGDVKAFTGYAATGSTTATQAAATDAARRLSVALADMIVSRVLILSPELAR
jgi:LPS-assembly lipoprotein